MGNKISVLWQLSTPGSLSGWLSHFGIMSTQWKAPLKFSQTQCTQDSASFMGPHNWSPIIPKVTSLSAGYQNNIGGFSTRAQAHFLKSGSTGRNICAFMKTLASKLSLNIFILSKDLRFVHTSNVPKSVLDPRVQNRLGSKTDFGTLLVCTNL